MSRRLTGRVLKCSAFITTKTASGSTPVATAFLVRPTPDETSNVYVVTARHCVEGSDEIYLRLNRMNREEGCDDLPISGHWRLHAADDIAVRRVTLGDEYDHAPLDVYDFEALPSSYPVGVGDSVYMVSLFLQRPGVNRVLPIARFGNISALRDERVNVELSNGRTVDLDAYLIEARSWGGHSGSPVFVYLQEGREEQHPTYLPGFGRLLGVVSGHYLSLEVARLRGNTTPLDVDINSGIAIVTPSEYVLDLIRAEERGDQDTPSR
ncbi:MAG TPA: serine protease [Candidatus Angelobacter sp.]|jgi:hypothetical protein|nr:serine protease [Candidatus Angelobacter sp.]